MIVGSLGAFGQKFIEVTATDSVLLKPKKITFEVVVGDGGANLKMMGLNLGQQTDEDPEQILEKQKNLRKVLVSNGIKFYEKPVDDLTLKGIKSVTKPYYIDVKNYAEAIQLLEKLKAVDGIQAEVSHVEHERTEAIEKLLLQRILAKAKKDAELLAGLSGLKVGAVAEIKEAAENDYGNFFEKMMKKNPIFGAGEQQLNQEYRRTFTIKFQIIE